MKKITCDRLSNEQKAELEALAALPSDQIQPDDLPEVRAWSGAKRGMFYCPLEQHIMLHLEGGNRRFVQPGAT